MAPKVCTSSGTSHKVLSIDLGTYFVMYKKHRKYSVAAIATEHFFAYNNFIKILGECDNDGYCLYNYSFSGLS